MKKLFLSIPFLVLSACNLHGTSPLALDPNAATKTVVQQGDDDIPYMKPDQITYALVNEKILAKKCVACHSEKAGNKGGVNLENYKNVFEAKDDIRDEVFNRTMPIETKTITKLTDSEVQFILDWIDLGAKEKVDQDPTTPPVVPNPPVITPPTTTPVTPPTTTPPVVVPPTTTPPVVEPPTTTPPVVNPPVPVTEIYFADVLEKVLKPSCIKCHGQAGGVNLETYENFMLHKDESRQQIATGAMPKRSTLTDDQKTLILNWIDQGAKEAAGAPPYTPPPAPVLAPVPPLTGPIYFADVYEFALKRNCISCHTGGQNGGVFSLNTYNDLKDFTDDLGASVESGEMPMGKKMPDDEKAFLLKWIENGAPEKAP